MPRGLLALVILIPAIELWGIIQMVRWIGGWETIALLIITGMLGAWLIKIEGRRVWQQAQRQMQDGQAPGHTLLDGLCVLAGGILLMLPGFISDIIGLTMLIPFIRPLYRVYLYRWLERKFRNGNLSIYRGQGPNR